MSYTPTPRRGFLRFALLLASLLHFGGAAAGPWVHALAGPETAAASGTRGGDRRDPDRPAPHSELACVVCQALGGAALPAEAAAFTALATPGSPCHPKVPSLRPVRLAPLARARAPPVA